MVKYHEGRENALSILLYLMGHDVIHESANNCCTFNNFRMIGHPFKDFSSCNLSHAKE